MSSAEEAPETKVLATHECWRSLRSSSIGRLAVIGSTGPEIFPVNYLPEDGTLIFGQVPEPNWTPCCKGERLRSRLTASTPTGPSPGASW